MRKTRIAIAVVAVALLILLAGIVMVPEGPPTDEELVARYNNTKVRVNATWDGDSIKVDDVGDITLKGVRGPEVGERGGFVTASIMSEEIGDRYVTIIFCPIRIRCDEGNLRATIITDAGIDYNAIKIQRFDDVGITQYDEPYEPYTPLDGYPLMSQERLDKHIRHIGIEHIIGVFP